MEKMKTTSAAFALLLASTMAAHAQSDCDNPRDDFDGLYCLTKVYVEADKELNDNYKKLVEKLDDEGRKTLRNTQRTWIEERNDQCSRREDGRFFVNMRCAADTTIARSHFLQDRYRECVSSGCRNSKL